MESSANGHTRALVRVRLSFTDQPHFVERFAGRLSRGVMFVPSSQPLPVGSTVRLELTLRDGQVVFSAEGDVIWVKERDPATPTRGPGMGVQLSGVSASSVPVLELLERAGAPPGQEPRTADEPPAARREADEPRSAPLQAEPASPPPDGPPLAAVPPVSAPVEPRPEAMPPPIGDHVAPAAMSPVPDPIPPRPARSLAWPAALAAAALIAIGLARLRPAPPPAAVTPEPPAPLPAVIAESAPPASSATPISAPEPPAPLPAVTAEPAPPAAPEPAPPEPEPAPAPPRRAPSGLRIESILTGPTYAHYTCPEPTTHFSLQAHRRVNVCLQIAPMLAPVEETVNVVWERNGAFYGSTELTIPARHIPHRTRVHMAIDERRVGDWSIRVVSRKGKELARSTFQVGP